MNVDQTAQRSVLRWGGLAANGLNYLVVLRSIYQTVAQTSLRVFDVGIAQAERKIEGAFLILDEYIKVTFRRPAVAFFNFIFDRTQPKSHAIPPHQRTV